jgi:hypothetical protein
MSDNTVFQEVQAALLNSECDPYEAGKQGLCALYSFVGTELAGSPLAQALERALRDMRLPLTYGVDDVAPSAPKSGRKELRSRVLRRGIDECERKK